MIITDSVMIAIAINNPDEITISKSRSIEFKRNPENRLFVIVFIFQLVYRHANLIKGFHKKFDEKVEKCR